MIEYYIVIAVENRKFISFRTFETVTLAADHWSWLETISVTKLLVRLPWFCIFNEFFLLNFILMTFIQVDSLFNIPQLISEMAGNKQPKNHLCQCQYFCLSNARVGVTKRKDQKLNQADDRIPLNFHLWTVSRLSENSVWASLKFHWIIDFLQ